MILMCSILIISCSKDDFNPDLDESPVWEPEIALPLAYTEVGMSDLVHANDSSAYISAGNDQFCTLIYQGNIFELTSSQIIQVPDQNHQSQFYLNNGQILTLVNSGQVQVSVSQDIVFGVSQGAEIDSMVLKNSQLQLNFNSSFPSNAEVRLTIPGLVKDGMVFSNLITLNPSGSIPVISNTTFPLHEYHLDLTKNGTTSNTLELNFAFTISGNGAGVTSANSIECNAVLQSMEYKMLYGYIGQQSFGSLQDTLELSIFNNTSGTGSFTIVDPKIKFDLSNSIGIPLQARISQLKALNGNLTHFTVATGIPDPLPVSSPGINQAGQSLLSSFTMNNSNSNINSLINEQPKYIIVGTQVNTNPAGPAINFLSENSKLSMNVNVELPLFGTANDFTIKDTVPFNYHDLDKVENLVLRINVENWFPIDAGIQLIFTDDNFLPVDTVFLPGEVVIPSGIITGNNERVTIAGTKIHDHTLDKNRIESILDARHIIVEATATSYQQGNQNVKIFNDYKLKLKFGTIARMKIQ